MNAQTDSTGVVCEPHPLRARAASMQLLYRISRIECPGKMFYDLYDIKHSAIRESVFVPKIIPMPKSAEGKPAAVAPNSDSEHILRYPRLRRGSHFADFMRDKRLSPDVYHCVIQRIGSNAIFSWTQHSSLEAAMKNAEIALTLILGSSVVEA